jgi:4-diphosphocytidyl-2-C-methyl-D-erythritol kinase
VTTQAQRGKPVAQITLASPAKINVYLRIVGKRPDGFHEIESIMLPLEFGDRITLQLRKTSIAMDCDNPDLPTNDSNLALRAANLFAATCPMDRGVKIHLHKRIPLASGLGGGSSNAATVLRGLNQLWQANASTEQLDTMAASLGSDVNLFLRNQPAICRGRGEQVTPLPCRLNATVLLINPGFGIATKWAYESWAKTSALLTQPPPDVTLLTRALADNDLAGVARGLYNSLEAPSVRKFPVLHLLKEAMRANGASGTLMSGSGATVFGLFAKSTDAETAAQQIRAEFGPSMWTETTRFLST